MDLVKSTLRLLRHRHSHSLVNHFVTTNMIFISSDPYRGIYSDMISGIHDSYSHFLNLSKLFHHAYTTPGWWFGTFYIFPSNRQIHIFRRRLKPSTRPSCNLKLQPQALPSHFLAEVFFCTLGCANPGLEFLVPSRSTQGRITASRYYCHWRVPKIGVSQNTGWFTYG